MESKKELKEYNKRLKELKKYQEEDAEEEKELKLRIDKIRLEMANSNDLLLRKAEIRSKTLLKKYGITVEQWNEMYNLQGGKCAICSKIETKSSKTGASSLVVDHCHSTGRVRGLLCSGCNTMLGAAKDNQSTLANGIEYLKTRIE